jgi:hypothetical protein
MTTLAPAYTPKFGRIMRPTNKPLRNWSTTSVPLLLSKLGFVLSCGFIGYLLAMPH